MLLLPILLHNVAGLVGETYINREIPYKKVDIYPHEEVSKMNVLAIHGLAADTLPHNGSQHNGGQ